MPFTAEYDREADALYLRIAGAGQRARTVEIHDALYVDVDADGRPVGVEVLYPSLGVDLNPAADRFGLRGEIPAMVRAIAHSGAPVDAPTYTGGGIVMSMTMVSTSVEGTVAAIRETGAPAFTGADPVPVVCA